MNHTHKTVQISGAHLIARTLELYGVKTAFGYPGGAVLPLYDALPQSSIHTVLVRNEQGAALAANGYARATGNVGVCFATSGPGMTNLVTGLLDSYFDNIPVVAITGQVPSHLIGTDAFQEADATGCALPCTKESWLVLDPNDILPTIIDAFDIARNGRPGPVLVDIPKDVQAAMVELPENWESQFLHPEKQRQEPTKDAIKEAQEILQNAQKPLVMCGHGIILSDCVPEIQNMIQTHNLPVITTIMALNTMPHEHPNNFGWLGMHGMKYANLIVQEADTILAIGLRFDDRITGKLAEFAPNAKIVHVDTDPSEFGKNVLPRLSIHADAKQFTQSFSHNLVYSTPSQWINRCNELKAQYPMKHATTEKMNEINAIGLLNKHMPQNTYITTDVGQHQMWSGQYLTNLTPGHFYTSGGLGTMGYGLPAAMGVAAAKPTDTVWCVSGDGSFQMNLQEMMTCTQENYNLNVLLLDNEYLGMVRQWQERFYDKNYSGVKLTNPDFNALAKAFGWEARTCRTPEELSTAIIEAQNHTGPFLIHTIVEKDGNVYPMVPPGKSLSETLYYPDSTQ